MGIPTILPGLPPPDVNLDHRTVLGGVDLMSPIVTDFGVVTISGFRLEGWSGGTGSTRDSAQRAYRAGAVSSTDPQSKPRIMTLSFTLNAESPAAMREAWDLLNVAASKNDTTLTRDLWGSRRSRTVYRQGDIGETLYRSALRKGWSCQLKADDPRMYGELITETTGLPFTSGGLVFPVTFPVTSNATSDTGIVSIYNGGNEHSPVVLRIDGPVPAPKIAHVGSDRALTFASSYVLPAGNWLDVDLDNRRVLENGIADRAQFITERGFFDAEPGRNDYAFQADSYHPDARMTVTTAPAWE